MAAEAAAGASRHSILDLAPLELDCMNALWPSGEATVRQIQEALRPTRPRAYTTIMTILDRLAQKGIVQRRKSGRAWVYRANVTAVEARTHAVAQVVDGFFGGSAGALATHLAGQPAGQLVASPTRLSSATPRPSSPPARRLRPQPDSSPRSASSTELPAPANLDTALL